MINHIANNGLNMRSAPTLDLRNDLTSIQLIVGVERSSARTTNSQKGFSLLELLVVISLSAMFFALAGFSYRYWIVQQQVVHDTQVIAMVLNAAREVAMLHGHGVTVKVEEQLLLHSEITTQYYRLSGDNNIIIRAFPHYAQDSISFHSTGFTATQNASIYICPPDLHQFAQKVVINQAGRIYIADEDVAAYCE